MSLSFLFDNGWRIGSSLIQQASSEIVTLQRPVLGRNTIACHGLGVATGTQANTRNNNTPLIDACKDLTNRLRAFGRPPILPTSLYGGARRDGIGVALSPSPVSSFWAAWHF